MYSSFHEPATDGLRYLWSRDGMHWDSIHGTWLSPKVGKQHVMRDPSIQSTMRQSENIYFEIVQKGQEQGYIKRDLNIKFSQYFCTMLERHQTKYFA